MTVHQRRERELAQRRALIISTSRRLAESEGWDAVTTRRLADIIEYSQPVLYKHFSGKDDIVRAVTVEGFIELAAAMREARKAATTPVAAVRALAESYIGFAAANPRLYEAMFSMQVGLAFGRPDSPQPLVEAFTELRAVVADVAAGRDVDTLSELTWGTLHGLVVLGQSGRLRPDFAEERLARFVEQMTDRPEPGPDRAGNRS